MTAKKIFAIVISMAMLLLTLSGCGKNDRLSGKYVNNLDNNMYIEFSDNLSLVFHTSSGEAKGSYVRVADFVTLSIAGQSTYCAVDGDTLVFNDTIFIKETIWTVLKKFWDNNWLMIIIGLIALSIVYAIINRIVIKRTGKELEEHIDNFFEPDVDELYNSAQKKKKDETDNGK